jgi:predicted ester cyclase
MPESDRGLLRKWFEEVWNKKRREAIAELLAPGATLCEGTAVTRGPEEFYPFFDRLQATLSDIHVNVEDEIVEGDKICLRWSCTARHTGAGLGVPPTGKQVHITGMSMVRVKDGLLIEGWQNWDMLGLLQQIKEEERAPTYVAANAAVK